MIIHSVKIKNFRGVHEECNFEFNEPFVLLSAQNGMGKTTVVDAIEWALTGTIGRLATAYNTRSTNDTERRKNNAGIIKNKDAAPNSKIQVDLSFSHDNENFTIRRQQKKDILNPKESTCACLSGDPQNCKKILSAVDDGQFYRHHFCDIQKSINMQAYKRDELTELFSEFISNHDGAKAVASNLELFAADVQQLIDQRTQDTENVSKRTEDIKKALKQYKNAPMLYPYGQDISFDGETMDLLSLSEEQLQIQLQKLQLCIYEKCSKLLSLIMQDRLDKEIISKLVELQEVLKQHKDDIHKVYQISPSGSLASSIAAKQKQFDNLKLLKVNRNTLPRLIPQILQLAQPPFTQEFYNEVNSEIQRKGSQLTGLKQDVSQATEGNRILGMLTDLIGIRDPLLEYKARFTSNGQPVKCPVCGSTQFGQIPATQVLKEAQDYISENDRIIGLKKASIKKLEGEIDSLYGQQIVAAQAAISLKKQELEKELTTMQDLETNCSGYFEILSWLKINYTGFTSSTWTDSSSISNLIQQYQSHLQPDTVLNSSYKQCLFLLRDVLKVALPEGNYLDMSVYEMTKQACSEAPAQTPSSTVESLVAKIRSIESMLSNREYMRLQNDLPKQEAETNRLRKELQELSKLKQTAEERRNKILDTIQSLEKSEFEALGPYLRLLYKKLARVDSISEVHLKNIDGKISLVDEQDKNIVNILSNGQLSVFVLAYFFAGILSRADNELCKVYFIDDLTACMDDVNMLAFLDLLKYQMISGPKNIDQIFFASCDSRVCNLLRYKLTGSQIPFVELNDALFSARIPTN